MFDPNELRADMRRPDFILQPQYFFALVAVVLLGIGIWNFYYFVFEPIKIRLRHEQILHFTQMGLFPVTAFLLVMRSQTGWWLLMVSVSIAASFFLFTWIFQNNLFYENSAQALEELMGADWYDRLKPHNAGYYLIRVVPSMFVLFYMVRSETREFFGIHKGWPAGLMPVVFAICFVLWSLLFRGWINMQPVTG